MKPITIPEKTFIDENAIQLLIDRKPNPDSKEVDEILAKAMELKGLDLVDVATLLNIKDKDNLEKLYATAHKIKDEIYGKRLVLFAPLYVANYCANNCLYCGFRLENKDIERRVLSIDEVKEETLAILEQGHKRILMLMGEDHKMSDLDYFYKTIEAAYSVKDSKGSQIRRINIEIQALSEEEFNVLKDIKIGTYTLFQETYHPEVYKVMHPSGRKANYKWRLYTMDRALANGMHDVGIGALFGLTDYRFEVLSLVTHAQHLDKEFGTGPHTISIPRIRPASGAPAAMHIPNEVSDENFKKLVAILRMSVPYTGMILSTRESAGLRMQLFDLGISQISAGSRTSPGGYKQAFDETTDDSQFTLNDSRSSGEVIEGVIKQGYIPSFCTACYRLGRVGQDFMDLAKPGLIKLFCLPNALTTLKEYLVDYANPETKQLGEALIERELREIPTDNVRNTTMKYLDRIEKGDRDLYF
ncbi:MAG TPA: [FeFe] hydrogenase H-cluster radical SAM maturase HydG [Candidatus Kapabacteria bacterium]|nr:[FeFe] hydrogenase H-cluster radical SAM maturase HydG [Candidatus Kapabacteria bacterium]HOV92628.1 [FeFe] hydrogenase H-cluster radical SAM maturase HydG [Candidatus Kapabacteria bacterium]